MGFLRGLRWWIGFSVVGVSAWAADPVVAVAVAPKPLPAAERGLPVLRNIPAREYGGHYQIWDITETADGVMLFSHLNQIAEFDGQTWRAIDVPGGSYVRAMESDAQGTVWVAGDNELGRLVTGPDGRLVYASMRAQVPAELGNIGPIWKIFTRPDGVWFHGNVAMLRWDGAKFEVWPIKSTRTAACFPFEDSFLVCADFGWKIVRPGGQWETFSENPALVQNGVRFLLPRGPGEWFVCLNSTGVHVLTRAGTLTKHVTPADDWFATSRPYQQFTLPDGRFLITSLQSGMLVTDAAFNPEVWINETTGLKAPTVITGYVDRRNILWIGTDRGICRVDLFSSLTVFNEAHGLGPAGVESLERLNGRVVVGGGTSVLELRPAEKPVGLPKFHVIDKTMDRSKFVMRLADGIFSGNATGAEWIANGKVERIESPSGIRELSQWKLDPTRYIGTHLNGLCSWHRVEGKWIYEGVWADVTGELRGLVQDDEGRFWTSTANQGLLRITPARGEPKAAKIERFAEESGLLVNRTRVWMNWVAGAPLFRTPLGLFRFDEATARFYPDTRYSKRFVGTSDRARLVAQDDAGGLWMAVEAPDNRPKEIIYAHDGDYVSLPMVGFSERGQLTFLIWEKSEGREILWVGSEAELWQIDLVRWRQQPAPALGRTLLREINSGGRARVVAPGEVPEFKAEENTLRFTFATIGLAGEKQPRHETNLRGFRDGGRVESVVNDRTFTNLPPGRYVFEARGLTEDGRRSEPAEFAFVVLAPWWQTRAALAAWFVLGGGALAAYIRWRIRRLTRERNRLENVVAERTAELARKNLDLERLHRLDQDEKLAARLAEEKAVLELLRYQLNPHFLFNSLNSIRALVYSNPDAAGEMVTRLSDFCRHTLTRSGDELTTVAQELEMTRTYLEIERARWQDHLVTEVTVTDDAHHQVMPRFLFLPLIENAIKYGGRTSPGVLRVCVSVRVEGQLLVCEVANTGEWKTSGSTPPVDSTHIGLENMRRRLARHFGRGAALEIVPGDGWVRVRLRLPLITEYVPAQAARRISEDPVL
jgi:ligand-binding sensor domain-containing protein